MIENREDNFIKEGDSILIVFDSKRRWIRKVKAGEKFHCNKGFFDFDEIIGQPFGTTINTNKSIPLHIYRPTLPDFMQHLNFKSQIIYPKDLGYILVHSGIRPGSTVIETGTGSGALTSILAAYVQPYGHVYTYEIREKAQEAAKENIRRLGLEQSVTFKLADSKEGFTEKGVDCVVLDLAEPWEIIPHAYDSLKSSGIVTLFIPTTNQLEKAFIQLKNYNFGDIKAIELIEREMQLKENAIRPKTWTYVGHTGYLMFARKRERINQSQDEIYGINIKFYLCI
ncbi:MAG: tRNA (adenine-N1)-methyltransferase [Candidatus Heimdallarchaeaceae archaeon]